MTKEDAKAAYAALMKFYPLTLDNLNGEEWKDIANYDGKYQISNFGRVKSFCRGTCKILKPNFVAGYLRFELSMNNERKCFLAHRLVAETFIPNNEEKKQVNHIDGHKFNNYVDNLEWVTSSENAQHAYDIQLKKSGVERATAKLTTEQVIYIRDNPDALNTYQLAKIFGVDVTLITAVQCGKRYKHVGGKIRKAHKYKHTPTIAENVKAAIRAEYKKDVPGYGSNALAKKYGFAHTTILRIVNKK